MSFVWLCRRSDVAEDASAEAKVLTVGQEFKLKCTGSGTPLLKAESLRLDLPAEQKYALKVLKTLSLEANQAEFILTTYQTGAIAIQDVRLSDGVQSISLTGIEFQVASLLQVEPGKTPEPFPARPSVWMWWPVQVWLLLAILITASLLVVAWVLRAAARQGEFLRQLEQRATHLSPADQLNKDIRNIAKLGDFDERRRQLEESVRWYLALKFKVNVLDQRHSQPQKLARELSRAVLKSSQLKMDPALREELSHEIEAFFREVSTSRSEATAPVASHWEGLEQLARRVITASERSVREKGGP
jgi:hypothetical protein